MIYEVNLTFDRAIAERFAQWLPGHVRQVLGSPGFKGARIYRVQDDELNADQLKWVVHYDVESEKALERYLQERAPELRADGEREFGASLVAARRVLDLIR